LKVLKGKEVLVRQAHHKVDQNSDDVVQKRVLGRFDELGVEGQEPPCTNDCSRKYSAGRDFFRTQYSFLPSFRLSFLSFFLPFLPSFLPSSLPSLPSFLPSSLDFLPAFLPSLTFFLPSYLPPFSQ
jgi:hypothetical protein